MFAEVNLENSNISDEFTNSDYLGVELGLNVLHVAVEGWNCDHSDHGGSDAGTD